MHLQLVVEHGSLHLVEAGAREGGREGEREGGKEGGREGETLHAPQMQRADFARRLQL